MAWYNPKWRIYFLMWHSKSFPEMCFCLKIQLMFIKENEKKIKAGHNCIVGMLYWICTCEVWLFMLLYFVHFVKQYTNEHVSLKCLCRRHSHSSIVSKNISLMNIHVNNDFKSRAAGTMGGKARTLILSALQMLSFVTLKAQIWL